DNSPLLSNTINNIAINKYGDIFFGTDKGIISLRGRATEGKKTNSDVVVYPNPVRKGYTGLVGIKNLVANSLVKITTVDGSFVTHLYSEGGQAIWDCTNINGERVSPGVYLIFVNDQNGVETFATKILIM
ncbi:MAG: T9SS type A sorting domain-containing protein, partial [Bacteroidales bacterium]|nr:T9SS type A sorting domain-containing protein [Bacteroidales bacterium]